MFDQFKPRVTWNWGKLQTIGLVVALAVLAAGLQGCESEGGDSSLFSFIVLSDVHVRIPGAPDDVLFDNALNIANLEHAVGRVNNEFPASDFVVATGDLVGNLFSENPGDYVIGGDNPADRYKQIMDGLNVPHYSVLGNHDYLTSFSIAAGQGIFTKNLDRVEAVWRKVLGIEPYYSFVHEGIRFVLLNSNRGAATQAFCTLSTIQAGCAGSFDDAQLDWLESQLQEPEPCLLFFHHPVLTDNWDDTWFGAGTGFNVHETDRFYDVSRMYKDRIKGIFVGHVHFWARDSLHGTIPVYGTAAVGDITGHRDNMHIVRVREDGTCKVSIGNRTGRYLGGVAVDPGD